MTTTMTTSTAVPETDFATLEWAGRARRAGHAAGFAHREHFDAEIAEIAAYAVQHPLAPARVLSAWLTGDTIDQALAASKLDAYAEYIDLRRNGAAHDVAFREAAATHVHRFTTTVVDGRCKVLNTGTVTVTRTCECGTTFTDRRSNNYSGD